MSSDTWGSAKEIFVKAMEPEAHQSSSAARQSKSVIDESSSSGEISCEDREWDDLPICSLAHRAVAIPVALELAD